MKKIKKTLFCLLTAIMIVSGVPTSGMFGVETTIVAEAATPKMSVSKKSIYKGKTYTLTLKNVSAGKKVTWSTSKKSVATVKANGTKCVVTGKKAGKATITAKVGSKKYKCTITVKSLPVSLSEKTKTLKVGDTFNLTLKNATSAKWSTSKSSVASIKKVSATKYTVTAKKSGTATITAKVGSKKYTCKVTVKAQPIEFSTGRKQCALRPGEKEVVALENATGSITWSLANKNVATFKKLAENKVEIVGVDVGETTITAKVNGKNYVYTIYVSPWEVYRNVPDLGVGIGKEAEVAELCYRGKPVEGKVEWSFKGLFGSTDDIVEITPTGSSCKVKGLKVGCGRLYAGYNGKTYSWYVYVTIPKR